MILCGFTDEAGSSIEAQIRAVKALGWKHLEARNVDGVNLADLDEEAFERTAAALRDAGVAVWCFGSAVANWAKDPRSDADFEKSLAELGRALPRMERLGTRFIRGMSFKVPPECWPYPAELERTVFRKVETLVRRCEEAGVVYLHENCMNYGGLSAAHTLRLVEHMKSDAFGLVFDTGNPLHARDRSGPPPHRTFQNPWDFYLAVRPHIRHIHIKDSRATPAPDGEFYGKGEYTWPGEGEAQVRRIAGDLLERGYDGAFSIEPHLAVVYHDSGVRSSEADKFESFVEYGARFERLLRGIRVEGESGSGIPPR